MIFAPRPYLRLQYEFSAHSYAPQAARHYSRCDYWSPGRDLITLRPASGACPLIHWQWS